MNNNNTNDFSNFQNQNLIFDNMFMNQNLNNNLLSNYSGINNQNLNPNNFNDFNFTMLNLQYEMNNNNNNEKSKIGNWKTMLVMINYVHESFSESLSTLHFAQRDKKIKNRSVINEDLNNRALIRQYELGLRNLRNELEKKIRCYNLMN